MCGGRVGMLIAKWKLEYKMKYKYKPNELAIKMFNLTAKDYYNYDGLTPLLEEVLGHENYSRYIFAQDPLCNSDNGKVEIVLTAREDVNAKKSDEIVFESIGSVSVEMEGAAMPDPV